MQKKEAKFDADFWLCFYDENKKEVFCFASVEEEKNDESYAWLIAGWENGEISHNLLKNIIQKICNG